MVSGASFLGSDIIVAFSHQLHLSLKFLFSFLNDYLAAGIQHVISTDISRDGALTGPAFDLYADIKLKHPTLNVIASGGVSGIEDVAKLNEMNIDGVIIGKALYEGKITLESLGPYLA